MQKIYAEQYKNNDRYYDWSCKKSGSGKIEVTTEESYVKKLLAYFKKR